MKFPSRVGASGKLGKNTHQRLMCQDLYEQFNSHASMLFSQRLSDSVNQY